MKLIILFSLLCTVLAVPLPAENDKVNYQVQLDDGGSVSYQSDPNTNNYQYRVEQKDGTIKQESGRFEGENAVVEGAYQFMADNGMTYSVQYVADENGYRPRVAFGRALDSAVLGSLLGGGGRKRSHKETAETFKKFIQIQLP